MSLVDEFLSDKKLMCPRCRKEVYEYPHKNIKQAKFKCKKCKSVIKFIKKGEIFISWVTDEF